MEPADPGQVAAAAAVIVAADPADPDSIGSLQGIRFTAAGTEAAREALESGVTGDALWAATWVYATAGDDPAPLLPQVTSDSDSVRALAAAGLASLGVVDGLAALASSVDSTSALEGSEPPLSVGTYAAGALRMLTGADPGPAGWTAWLDAHRSLLVYDPEARTWSAP